MTSATQWKAVTVNLGGAGPMRDKHEPGAVAWAERSCGKYQVVFVQEIPNGDWVDRWRREYEVFEFIEPKYRARTAVLVRRDVPASDVGFATAEYHRSYVAAARAVHPTLGSVVLMSVHASPNPVSESWARQWKDCDVGAVAEYRGVLYDSDLVVETVRMVAAKSQVIAAGDWNEARGWDVAYEGTHPGTSGADFFARVERYGLLDCCCPGGVEGDPTHEPEPGRGQPLHIDHVFTTPHVLASMESPPIAPTEWPADHRPVEFTIG